MRYLAKSGSATLVRDNRPLIEDLFDSQTQFNEHNYTELCNRKYRISFAEEHGLDNIIPESMDVSFPSTTAKIQKVLMKFFSDEGLLLTQEVLEAENKKEFYNFALQLLKADAVATQIKKLVREKNKDRKYTEQQYDWMINKAKLDHAGIQKNIDGLIERETSLRVFHDVDVLGDGSCYYYAVLVGLMNACLKGVIAEGSEAANRLKKESGLFDNIKHFIQTLDNSFGINCKEFEFIPNGTIKQWVEQLIITPFNKKWLMQQAMMPALRQVIADFAQAMPKESKEYKILSEKIKHDEIHMQNDEEAIDKAPEHEVIERATELEFTQHFAGVRNTAWGSMHVESYVIKLMYDISVESFDAKEFKELERTPNTIYIRNLGSHFHAGFLKICVDERMINFCNQALSNPPVASKQAKPAAVTYSPNVSSSVVSLETTKLAAVAMSLQDVKISNANTYSPKINPQFVSSSSSATDEDAYKKYCTLTQDIVLLASKDVSVHAKILECKKLFDCLPVEKIKKATWDKKLKAFLNYAKPGSVAHTELTDFLIQERVNTTNVTLNIPATTYSTSQVESKGRPQGIAPTTH